MYGMYISVCMNVCMNVFMYVPVRMNVQMYANMYVCISTYIYSHPCDPYKLPLLFLMSYSLLMRAGVVKPKKRS